MEPICAPGPWLLASWSLACVYFGFLLGLLAGKKFWGGK